MLLCCHPMCFNRSACSSTCMCCTAIMIIPNIAIFAFWLTSLCFFFFFTNKTKTSLVDTGTRKWIGWFRCLHLHLHFIHNTRNLSSSSLLTHACFFHSTCLLTTFLWWLWFHCSELSSNSLTFVPPAMFSALTSVSVLWVSHRMHIVLAFLYKYNS